ncbi:Hypothetical predicted protein, partial [Paramuricea clavata]
VVISRLQELCSSLLTLGTECCHKRTNIEASKCLAGLINRIKDDNKVEEEIRKCLQKLDPLLEAGRSEDEKWRATIVLIWITKALLIRAHSFGVQLLEKKKISRKLHGKVESALEDLSYTCGSVFSDLEDEEMRGVFYSVFVKASLDCSQPTEKPWYAAGFEDICFFCGVEDDLNTNPESYPLCEECKKPRKPEKRSSRKKFKKT